VLVNESKSPVTLSIPRTHSTHQNITLPPLQEYQIATYVYTPGQNVGFRNVTIQLPTVAPKLSISINPSKKPVLSWHSIIGQYYVLQWSPNLQEPWTNLQQLPVNGTDGILSIEDPAGVGGPAKRFYRVVTGRP
jgi:hypothetical protein